LHRLLDDAPHDVLGVRARAVVAAHGEAIGTRSWERGRRRAGVTVAA
jgi:hypothetical protein